MKLNIWSNAVISLMRNPMRSLLTTLGIIIGVASVIAIMEVGAGATGSLETTLSDLGVRNILIRPGSSVRNGVRLGVGAAVTLTVTDCEAIRRECPAVKSAVPMFWANVRAIYGNNNWSPAETTGSTPECLTVRNLSIERGKMFTAEDVRRVAPVCVIGQTVEKELFGSKIGEDKLIRINNVMFQVVGVLNYKGANLIGQDQDDVIIMPWTTLRFRVTGMSSSRPKTGEGSSGALYPEVSAQQLADTMFAVRFLNIDSIMATVWTNDEVEKGKVQISALLRERHRLQKDAPDDFYLRDYSEIGNMINRAVKLVKTLLTVVAAISLMVGGIGIMNIMLVSVTERTREIGLRMAVGARGSDILVQFLVESVVLCWMGGLIGVMVGRGIALLLQLLLGWTAGASLSAAVVGLLVSMGVGIVFGFYPAWKASKLDPIEALRYE